MRQTIVRPLALMMSVLMVSGSMDLKVFAEADRLTEPEIIFEEMALEEEMEDIPLEKSVSDEDNGEEDDIEELIAEENTEKGPDDSSDKNSEEMSEEIKQESVNALCAELTDSNLDKVYHWNTVDGKQVSNQAEEKPKALLFFPATKNPGEYYDGNELKWGTLRIIYEDRLIHNGKYVDTVILDTGKKTIAEIKSARDLGKKSGTMVLAVDDKIEYCYDTSDDENENQIISALREYCLLAGMEADPNEGYYFLFDGKNRMVACESTAENDFEINAIGARCSRALCREIELRNDLAAPSDLSIAEYTDTYVKLTWTASAEVDEYIIYSAHQEYGTENDVWTKLYVPQVLRGLEQFVNGESVPFFDGNQVTVYLDHEYWNMWNDEEHAQFYVVPLDDCQIESSKSSNIVKLSDTGKVVDPEAYAKAVIVDDEGKEIETLTLHVGESVRLHVRLLKNNGDEEAVINDGKYHIEWIPVNYDMTSESMSYADEKNFRFYRKEILDTSNTYIKGLETTQETGGKSILSCCMRIRENIHVEDVIIPVVVLPAEDQYEDYEKTPDDVCGSVEALNQALLDALSNKEPKIQFCLGEDVLTEYESVKGAKWDIMDEIFHLYDGQEEVNPWEGDYLFYNMNFDMVLQGILPGFADRDVEYQGKTYISFILYPKYFREGKGDDAYVAERLDALINKPSGALYTCRYLATDKEKADACVDWIKKNVSYIGTTNEKYHSAYSALHDKKATCEGYTMLLYRMLKEFGIDSRLIGSELDETGTSHAFSLVMLDGKYYYYDATGGVKCKCEGEFGYTWDQNSVTRKKWMEFYFSGSPYYINKFMENIVHKLATERYTEKTLPEPDHFSVVLKNPTATYTYTGSAIKPEIIVRNNGEVLIENVDYTVSYANNVKASYDKDGNLFAANKLPRITVNGKGNLAGNNYMTFVIEPKNISELKYDSILYVEAGKKAAPAIFFNNVKLGNGDYKLEEPGHIYLENEKNPVVKVEAKAGGNYTGSVTIPVCVVAKSALKKFKVAVDSSALYYHQSVQIPEFTVKEDAKDGKELSKDDYYVIYPGGVSEEALEDGSVVLNAGSHKMIFVGKGLYSGCSVTKSYTIRPRAVGKNDVSDAFTVGGIEDATFCVTQDASLDNLTVTYHKGKEDAEVLVAGRDYKVTYSNNKKVSTEKSKAKCKISFIGNYKGSAALAPIEFQVLPMILNESTEGLEVVLPDKVYGAKAGVYKSTAYVSLNKVLLKASDYTVSYYLDPAMTVPMGSNVNNGEQKLDMTNLSVATVYVKLTGKGNYDTPEEKGHKTAAYTVYKKTASQRDISGATVTFYDKRGKKSNNVTYNGYEVKPCWIDVTYRKEKQQVALLTEGEDFTVCYINNVNKGKATAIFSGTGSAYVGSKVVTYNIATQNLKNIKALFQ